MFALQNLKFKIIMKKIFCLIPILLFTAEIFAQESGNKYYGNSNYGNNHSQKEVEKANFASNEFMELEINAMMNVQADEYVAVFNIKQSGNSASEVNDLFEKRYANFLTELQTLGILETDIFLDMVAFVPVFEFSVEKKFLSKTYNEVPKGFELQKNIHIRYKNRNLLDKILQTAAKSEIYDFVKVDYQIHESEKIYATLREKSIAELQKKTKPFLSLGIKFDSIFHILSEKSDVVYPYERYEEYFAYESSPSQQSSKYTTVNQARKSKTMYYEKYPYKNFDLVINPSFLEPAVQFMYNLKVRYLLKKAEKQYFIIGNKGELMPVKLD
ncbi:MAG: DUF541 domain-containing protein [Bacteroidetes bacterium]|nr:MAG: DUF541 domain-containing protein [Bacteroidota bacterium]